MSRSGWWWAPLCRKNERGPESEASSQRRKAGAARACTCTCTHARCIRRPARVTRRGLSDRRWDTIGKDLNEINFLLHTLLALRKPAKPSAAHSHESPSRAAHAARHTADRAHRVTRRPRIRWRCSSVRGPSGPARPTSRSPSLDSMASLASLVLSTPPPVAFRAAFSTHGHAHRQTLLLLTPASRSECRTSCALDSRPHTRTHTHTHTRSTLSPRRRVLTRLTGRGQAPADASSPPDAPPAPPAPAASAPAAAHVDGARARSAASTAAGSRVDAPL